MSTNFKVMKMSDVEGEVRGAPIVRAVSKELGRGARSATRSDRLASEMLLQGLGAKKTTETILEMLEATSIKKDYVDEVVNGVRKMRPVEVLVPDWKARAQAVKFVIDTQGWGHVVPKTTVNVNQIVIQSAEEARSTSTEDLLRKAEWAAKVVTLAGGDRIDKLKVQDAEVVE
jgi:hypothetical protein